jgi:predicted amidophosphoribosyltransferase
MRDAGFTRPLLWNLFEKAAYTPPNVEFVPLSVSVYRIISDLKCHGQLQLIDYFAEKLSNAIQKHNEQKPQLLIPIPLHSQRLRQRGYNQSAELAKNLARNLDIPFDNSALIRIKNMLPQA